MNIYPGEWPKRPSRPKTAAEILRVVIPLQIIQVALDLLIFLIMLRLILNG